MTLLDLIKLGLIETDARAVKFAADLIDRWHDGLIPGKLHDVLGLTPASTRHGPPEACRC